MAGFGVLPQTLNPYAYGLNNPHVYVDANGQFAPLVLAAIGAAIGAVVGGGAYYLTHRKGNFNWGEFASWTMVGAGLGALAGFFPLSLAAGMGKIMLVGAGIGAAIGGTAYVTSWYAQNQFKATPDPFSVSSLLINMGGGAVVGALAPTVGATVPGAMALGAGVNAAQYVVQQAVDKKVATPAGTLVAGAIGAGGGLLGGSNSASTELREGITNLRVVPLSRVARGKALEKLAWRAAWSQAGAKSLIRGFFGGLETNLVPDNY